MFSVLGALLLLVVGLICYCSFSGEETKKEGNVEQIEARTIANSVSGSGVVTSVNSEEVTSQQFGTKVSAVYVKEGDIVTPGQVICQLDTKNLQEQYNNVQDRIVETKNNRVERDNDYDNNLTESRNNRSKRINETNEKLQNARNEYVAALTDLDSAKKSYDAYIATPGHSQYDMQALQLQSNIQAKQSTVDVKKNAIDSYQDTLDSLNENDNEDNIKEAKSNYDKSTADTIENLEDQAKEIQKSIGECTIRSTIGGTVTNLSVRTGDSYNGGVVCSVEGLNALMVEAEVSEYDIPDIAVGMKVRMKTDATRDKELTGVVTYVAPRATSTSASGNSGSGLSSLIGMDASSLGGSSMGGGSNSATFKVKIALDEQNTRLRLGMNAKISIITNEVDDAISVPYDAVQEDENGNKYVEIVTNKEEVDKDSSIEYKKEKVNVVVGISGTYYTEVSGNGIKAGAYVFVPAATGSDSVEEIMNSMGATTGV